MKRNARRILYVIKTIQWQPTKIEDIAKKVSMSRRTTNSHLRTLEKCHLLTVDRSERPHAYELTAEAYVALQFEECRNELRSLG
jgi:DNA-binding IclR family transcriptional regulator